MNTLSAVRNKLFWAKDFFNKSIIRNNITDISNIIEDYFSPESQSKRQKKLIDILEHVITTVPYYKTFKNEGSLLNFPVVNKNIIRENYDKFKSSLYNDKNTFKISTSGSTGTPLIIYQNKQKKIRNTADTIYFAKRANFKPGNRLYIVKLWPKESRKSNLTAFVQNVKMINVKDFSDSYLSRFIDELKSYKSEVALLGYVSGYSELCKYLDRIKSSPINCNVTSILAGSESLTPYCKESMEKYFGAPVLSRYSNWENGILAQQTLESEGDFTLNWASYNFEIFKIDEDAPAEFGEPGRILITDLYNYAMPLIRYDTGDLGRLGYDKNGVPVLKEVQGRKLDTIFNTQGKVITSAIVWELQFYENIKQFQLIQEGPKHYTFRLNTTGAFKMEDKLIERYKSHLGYDAIINIEKTDEIPILASGKRRLVVNNYSFNNLENNSTQAKTLTPN